MSNGNFPTQIDLEHIAERYSLDLIVLFGSQAIGQARAGSDVDVAVHLANGQRHRTIAGKRCLPWEWEGRLINDLSDALHLADNLDLVILDRASPLLLYQVARQGRPLYQKEPTTFANFRLYALHILRDSQTRYQQRWQWVKDHTARWRAEEVGNVSR